MQNASFLTGAVIRKSVGWSYRSPVMPGMTDRLGMTDNPSVRHVAEELDAYKADFKFIKVIAQILHSVFE